MLQSWYQKTTQSLVNTLSSFSWHNRLPWQQYDLLKTPLITALGAYNSKTARWNFFISSTFDKHDKTQLLAKFKKILYMGLRATLNSRKFMQCGEVLYKAYLTPHWVNFADLKRNQSQCPEKRQRLVLITDWLKTSEQINQSMVNLICERRKLQGSCYVRVPTSTSEWPAVRWSSNLFGRHVCKHFSCNITNK